MAKKYNKSREQKPNYSKREKRLDNIRVEAGKDFALEDKLREQRTSVCDENSTSSGRNLKK